MRSYCVKQKKETSCVPGSERIRTAKNGRQMSICVCSECGITKTKFIAGKTGGAISKSDFSCGYDLKGKRAGTVEECFKKGQIRRWGVEKLDDGYIDALLADRTLERNRKARARRKAKKPAPISKALVPYIEPIVTSKKKKKKKSKSINSKSHIKKMLDKLQPGEFIQLADDVVVDTGYGYNIINTQSIPDDELVDIDWEDPSVYSDYVIGEPLSKTDAVKILYDLYKDKEKIIIPGN